MQDNYGYTISTSGPAVDAWLEGLEAGFSFDSSGIEQHTKALELAPDFALAHAALARQQLIHGQRGQAFASLDKANSLSVKVGAREASQIAVLSASMHYQADALALALAHIDRWPLDITVFSMVVGPFGMLAFSGQAAWREDSLALLQKYQQKWPNEDWWYQSALAFALAESAQNSNSENKAMTKLDFAQKKAEQSWQQKPTGNCAHTLSHIHFEQNDVKGGRAFLHDWLTSFGQTSDMRHHLVWHDVLYELNSGEMNHVSMTELYQTEFDPKVADPMPLTTFADNASFLWLCCLHGYRFDAAYASQMIDYADQYFPSLDFSFAAVHRVLITALFGADSTTESLRSSILGLEDTRSVNYLEQLLTAATAFTFGDHSECASHLQPLLQETVLIGGSNPQRAIVQKTYDRAKQLAGRNS